MTVSQKPEDIVRAAVEVARRNDPDLLRALDEIEAPLYVTDEEGLITISTRPVSPSRAALPLCAKTDGT
jgi:hypothetical protein